MSHMLRTLAGTPRQRDIHSADFLLVGQLRADLDEAHSSWSSLLHTVVSGHCSVSAVPACPIFVSSPVLMTPRRPSLEWPLVSCTDHGGHG